MKTAYEYEVAFEEMLDDASANLSREMFDKLLDSISIMLAMSNSRRERKMEDACNEKR